MKYLKINVEDIIRRICLAIEFEESLSLDDFSYLGEMLRFPEPLIIKGNISEAGEDMLLLTADVTGKVLLNCGYCTEAYEHPIDLSIEAKYNNALSDDDPDYYSVLEDSIDLSKVVLDFLLMELPIKRRCREDCKGLCSSCGTNLNHDDCTCKKDYESESDEAIDIRLEKLKEFFNND